MGDTFKQIQDDTLDYGYGEADRTRIKGFINDAYMDIFQRRQWAWAEGTATVNLSLGASSAAMPSMTTTPYQFGRIQKVTTPSSGYDPPLYIEYTSQDPISWVDNAVTAVGQPMEYSIWSGTIYFDRAANQAYAYQMIYWVEPTRMSGDSDEAQIPDYAREILRWGALKRLAAREHDQAAYQMYQKLEDDHFKYMLSNNAKNLGSQRARMPFDYYGAYDRNR